MVYNILHTSFFVDYWYITKKKSITTNIVDNFDMIVLVISFQLYLFNIHQTNWLNFVKCLLLW